MLTTRLANTHERRSFYDLACVIQAGNVDHSDRIQRKTYISLVSTAATYLIDQIFAGPLPLCVAIEGDQTSISEIYIATYIRDKKIVPSVVINPYRFGVVANEKLMFQMISVAYSLGFNGHPIEVYGGVNGKDFIGFPEMNLLRYQEVVDILENPQIAFGFARNNINN